jgi:hypothetical protein
MKVRKTDPFLAVPFSPQSTFSLFHHSLTNMYGDPPVLSAVVTERQVTDSLHLNGAFITVGRQTISCTHITR